MMTVNHGRQEQVIQKAAEPKTSSKGFGWEASLAEGNCSWGN